MADKEVRVDQRFQRCLSREIDRCRIAFACQFPVPRARKRIAKCIETFGQVPRSVFSLEVIPPFKNHRGDLSDAEKELLKRVTSGVFDDQDEAESSEQMAGEAGFM